MCFLSANLDGYFGRPASDVHTTVFDVSGRPNAIPSDVSAYDNPSRNGQICPSSFKVTSLVAGNSRNTVGRVYKYPQNCYSRSGRPPVNVHANSSRSGRPPVNPHTTSPRSGRPSVNPHTTTPRSGRPPVSTHTTSSRSGRPSVSAHTTSPQSGRVPAGRPFS